MFILMVVMGVVYSGTLTKLTHKPSCTGAKIKAICDICVILAGQNVCHEKRSVGYLKVNDE